jgi:hypothetical protein
MKLVHAAMLDMLAAAQLDLGFGTGVEQDNVHGITWTTTVKAMAQQLAAAVASGILIDAQSVTQSVHVSA